MRTAWTAWKAWPAALAMVAGLPSSVWAQPSEREAELFGEPPAEDADPGVEQPPPPQPPPGEPPGAPPLPAPEGDNPYVDEATREAELFGGEPEEPKSPIEERAPEPSAEPTWEGAGSRLSAALDAIYDTTELGGQLFLRLDYMVNPFKYGVVTDATQLLPIPEAGEDQPISSPNLLDVYLDSRPTPRIRGYVRGRFRYDPTIAADSRVFGVQPPREQVLLDQLWLKFDVLELAYVTVGRQPIRWGSGRFWNPTDFMNRLRRDPLAVFDERPGVDLIKVHIPVESLGWNFYAVANSDELTRPEETGVGGRAEFLFGQTELAASIAWRKDNPLQVGFDVSSALWYFDVRAELAMLYDVRTPFYAGAVRTNELGLPVAERTRDRSDELILQGVAGADTEIRYNEEGDTILLGVEYFYNDAGYNSSRYYPVLFVNGQFNPLYAGRHYLSAYATMLAPFTWDDTAFILSFVGNLSDESFLARFDYRVTFLTRLSFNAYATVHFGDAHGSLRGRIDPAAGATERVLALLDALENIPFPDEQTAEDLQRLLAQLGGESLQQQLELAAAAERGQDAAIFEAGVGLRIQF